MYFAARPQAHCFIADAKGRGRILGPSPSSRARAITSALAFRVDTVGVLERARGAALVRCVDANRIFLGQKPFFPAHLSPHWQLHFGGWFRMARAHVWPSLWHTPVKVRPDEVARSVPVASRAADALGWLAVGFGFVFVDVGALSALRALRPQRDARINAYAANQVNVAAASTATLASPWFCPGAVRRCHHVLGAARALLVVGAFDLCRHLAYVKLLAHLAVAVPFFTPVCVAFGVSSLAGVAIFNLNLDASWRVAVDFAPGAYSALDIGAPETGKSRHSLGNSARRIGFERCTDGSLCQSRPAPPLSCRR